MRALFGYLNTSNFNSISISSVSNIQLLDLKELYYDSTAEIELLKEYVIESVVLLVMSYFCIAVEIRFLKQSEE